MATFPASVASKPANITDGLQILASHVGTLWDEVVAVESELLGAGAGAFFLDIRPSAAGSVVFQSRQLTGDTQPRFQITGSGDHRWGSGAAATDVTLARTATRTMTLTGSEIIIPGNLADTPLLIKGVASQSGPFLEVQTSAASPLLRMVAAGTLILSPTTTPTTAAFGMQFGNDASANLYRSAAATISSDGILSASTLTSTGLISGVGVALLGNAANAYKSSTTTASNLFLRALVTGDTQDRFTSDHNGALIWGAGGASAPDTNLYRKAASVLATDDKLNLSPDSPVTTAAFGLQIGNDGVANLYRSAASELKTDAAFRVQGQMNVRGDYVAPAGNAVINFTGPGETLGAGSATWRLTVPVTGIYEVSLTFTFLGTTAGADWCGQVWVYNVSTTTAFDTTTSVYGSGANGYAATGSGRWRMSLTAGHVLAVFGQRVAGSTVGGTSGCSFGIALIDQDNA